MLEINEAGAAERPTVPKKQTKAVTKPAAFDCQALLEEANALALYVGRHGDVLDDVATATAAYGGLLDAITQVRENSTPQIC